MSKKVKQSKVKKMSRRKKIIITIIILLVLIAITFSGFYVFSGYSKNSTTNKSNGITATKKTSVDTTTLSTEAASVVAKSGYAAGQEYLDKALESASTSNDKATIYLHKSLLAISGSGSDVNSSNSIADVNNDSVKNTALEYAYESEKLNPTAASAVSIASLEESAGNLEDSIKYYKIYLERGANSYDTVNTDSDYEYYSNYIKTLEEKI